MNHWPLKEQCPMCQSERPGDLDGSRWREYCKEHLVYHVADRERHLDRVRVEIVRRILAEGRIGERQLTQHEATQEKKEGTESQFDYLVRLYEGTDEWDIDTLEDQILHPLFALGGHSVEDDDEGDPR